MSNDATANTSAVVSSGRLWYGTVGVAAIWFFIEMADVALVWEWCWGGLRGTSVFSEPGIRILLGIITFVSLAAATVAAVMAFRDWRTLSGGNDRFADSEARERREFMSYVGVFVSVSLGVGILWFVLPIYILAGCVRIH